jgi:hypothetical protein
MAHAQKPDFVFPRNVRVHLNRWRRQFSRLLAAEECSSAWVMLDTPRSEMAWEYWLPTPFASFPFTCPPMRHRVPPGSERAIPYICTGLRVYYSSFFPDFNDNFTRQILEKYTHLNLHENPSSGSRVVQCRRTDGQTDRTKLIVTFRNFANSSTKYTFSLACNYET